MTRQQQEMEKALDGKMFKIKKFTPEVASYWGFRLFGDLAAFTVSSGGLQGVKEKLPQLIKEFTRMPRAEFQEFQRDCLSFVAVKFDMEGFAPLVNSEGHLSFPEITGPTLMQLTTDSFYFTIKDFFAQWLQSAGMDLESGLSGQTSSPKTETGSGNSSSTQSGKDTGNSANSGTAPTP